MKNLKAIAIAGINRASGRNTPDGPMEEVINIGQRNSGLYEVIGKKAIKAVYNVNLELFDLYHFPVLEDTTLIGSLQETGEVWLIKENAVATILTIDDPGTEVFYQISHVGNILIIHTDKDVYYIKYDPTDESFTQLPELPTPNFYFSQDSGRVYGVSPAKAFTTFKEALADYLDMDNQMRKAGAIEGHVLIIAAWKLYDGSYVKHSHIAECWCGGGGVLCDTSATYQFDNIRYHKMCGETYFHASDLIDLGEWAGIVQSLCFFITYPTSLYNIDVAEELYTADPVTATNLLPPHNEAGMRYLTRDQLSYYKVHEIPHEKLAHNLSGAGIQTTINFDIEVGNINILLTKEQLPVDSSSHHKLSAHNNFLYNKRQHYGDLVNKLYLGANPNYYALDGGALMTLYGYAGYTKQASTDAEWSITSVVYIKTSEGEKVVYNTWTQENNLLHVWELVANPDLIFLNHALSYPDIRAYHMKIYLYRASGGGAYFYINGYDLTPNDFHNFAAYINYDDTIEDIYPIEIDLTGIAGDEITPTEFAAASSDILDRYYNDKNRVQLTGLDNPFIYPAVNSYRIGVYGKKILRTMAMGEAVSEGQFGQFPVYVFSESGLWAMELGSGEVVYSSINPLNSDILSNVHSVVNVGRGVIYATAKGLFLISGSQRVEISKTVEGRLDNPLVGRSDYEGFLDTDVFIELLSFISERTFSETLQGGRIGFDRNNNEVIVSYYDLDPTLSSSSASRSGSSSVDDATLDGYSYVYNLDSGQWTKISQQFNQFIDSYPDFLAIVGNELYNLTVESTQDRHIIIQSRPLTLGTHTFKKIVRCNLYGHFEPVVDTFPSFYIFGSQDGTKWHLLQGQQVPYSQNHETITIQRTDLGWCKYYIFLFVAQVTLDSNVEGIELEFGTRYTGKLR